jgi:hypothetical protein
MSQTGAAYIKMDLNKVFYSVNATLRLTSGSKHSLTELSARLVQHFCYQNRWNGTQVRTDDTFEWSTTSTKERHNVITIPHLHGRRVYAWRSVFRRRVQIQTQ